MTTGGDRRVWEIENDHGLRLGFGVFSSGAADRLSCGDRLSGDPHGHAAKEKGDDQVGDGAFAARFRLLFDRADQSGDPAGEFLVVFL